jgi:hypothetical protein
MEVIYEKTMLTLISAEIDKAQEAGKTIKRILLTSDEWRKLRKETTLSYVRSDIEPDLYRIVINGVAVEPEGVHKK